MSLERIRRLQESMDDAEAMLITNEKNQRYVGGWPFEDGYLFITKNESYLLTDGRYIEAAEAAAPEGLTVTLMSGDRKKMFSSMCCKNSVKRVLYEDSFVTVKTLKTFREWFYRARLVPAGRRIEKMREIKDDDEIASITAAQRIAEKAFDHILGFISTDRTEKEVALELEFFMRSHGAEGLSFPTIAVSGSASSLPHGVPRDRKLEKGFFTMDYGCLYNGYCSDMTRTVVIGKADEDMKLLYDTVKLAQMSAEYAVHEGITGGELDKIARDVIDATKFKGCFTHSLGHGVGLDIHEAPGVHGNSTYQMVKGSVITIEPGIYVKGKYGCRIEDMVAFGPNGPYVITDCPKQLIEL